jgi:molybdenum cofactor biosynthesis protein MoaC/molybdopterin converting factor subunit 1
VEVRLFAILRERAGTATVQLELGRDPTVADALHALAQIEQLRELIGRLPVRMAVNREYADEGTALSAGDELALIPPLSGGASPAAARVHVEIRGEPLSPERLRERVADPRAGAIVVFEGVTRDVAELDYEAYAEMAAERIETIARECALEHRLLGAAVEHRIGTVALGRPSVLVAVSAAHRREAFAGAAELISRIKAEAPIWKRELDGGQARWVAGVPAPGGGPDGLRAPAAASSGVQNPSGAPRLTHLDEHGAARMVDVGSKPATERIARARARVLMSPSAAGAVQSGGGPKGEVLAVARIAGVQAAKLTAQLIPLAHPLPLSFVDVRTSVDVERGVVELIAEARTVAATGVEMEAMTACSVAALTVYDMVKGLERGIEIERVVLLEKRGGRSDYRREQD